MASNSIDRFGPTLVFGLILIAAGVSLLLEHAQLINHIDLGRWWPVMLLAVGMAKLVGQGDDWQQGWLWLGIGCWFLLTTMTSVGFRDTWPMLLVLWGVSTIWSGLTGRDTRETGLTRRENSHVN